MSAYGGFVDGILDGQRYEQNEQNMRLQEELQRLRVQREEREQAKFEQDQLAAQQQYDLNQRKIAEYDANAALRGLTRQVSTLQGEQQLQGLQDKASYDRIVSQSLFDSEGRALNDLDSASLALTRAAAQGNERVTQMARAELEKRGRAQAASLALSGDLQGSFNALKRGGVLQPSATAQMVGENFVITRADGRKIIAPRSQAADQLHLLATNDPARLDATRAAAAKAQLKRDEFASLERRNRNTAGATVRAAQIRADSSFVSRLRREVEAAGKALQDDPENPQLRMAYITLRNMLLTNPDAVGDQGVPATGASGALTPEQAAARAAGGAAVGAGGGSVEVQLPPGGGVLRPGESLGDQVVPGARPSFVDRQIDQAGVAFGRLGDALGDERPISALGQALAANASDSYQDLREVAAPLDRALRAVAEFGGRAADDVIDLGSRAGASVADFGRRAGSEIADAIEPTANALSPETMTAAQREAVQARQTVRNQMAASGGRLKPEQARTILAMYGNRARILLGPDLHLQVFNAQQGF